MKFRAICGRTHSALAAAARECCGRGPALKKNAATHPEILKRRTIRRRLLEQRPRPACGIGARNAASGLDRPRRGGYDRRADESSEWGTDP